MEEVHRWSLLCGTCFGYSFHTAEYVLKVRLAIPFPALPRPGPSWQLGDEEVGWIRPKKRNSAKDYVVQFSRFAGTTARVRGVTLGLS